MPNFSMAHLQLAESYSLSPLISPAKFGKFSIFGSIYAFHFNSVVHSSSSIRVTVCRSKFSQILSSAIHISSLQSQYRSQYTTNLSCANVSDSLFIQCTSSADFPNGGAAFLTDCVSNFVNCQFVFCQAPRCGGAIFAFRCFNSSFFGCSFQNNSAFNHGGAVYFELIFFISFKNTNFSDNYAQIRQGSAEFRFCDENEFENCIICRSSSKLPSSVLSNWGRIVSNFTIFAENRPTSAIRLADEATIFAYFSYFIQNQAPSLHHTSFKPIVFVNCTFSGPNSEEIVMQPGAFFSKNWFGNNFLLRVEVELPQMISQGAGGLNNFGIISTPTASVAPIIIKLDEDISNPVKIFVPPASPTPKATIIKLATAKITIPLIKLSQTSLPKLAEKEDMGRVLWIGAAFAIAITAVLMRPLCRSKRSYKIDKELFKRLGDSDQRGKIYASQQTEDDLFN